MSDNTQDQHSAKSKPSRWRNVFTKIRLWWFRHLPIFFNGVSRIHYYEARERYFTLVELVRYKARLCDLEFPDFEHDKYFEYPRDFNKIEKDSIEQIKSMDDEKKERCYALLTCYESLIVSRNSLTRKQGDLNRLWRTLARVRSRLTKILVTSEMQSRLDAKDSQLYFCHDTPSSQLYFCHEEAFRLGVDNDPSIKLMLQDLAEATDSEGKTKVSPKYSCVLNALIERFNTIRTGRIHQQFINIKTYTKAFVILLLITGVLILIHGLIMDDKYNPYFKPNQSTQQDVEANQNIPAAHEEALKTADISSGEKNTANPLNFLILLFQGNMFFFIFFGGLTGGFFSVATRERPRDREPGEDVYYTFYVLTKPFIGALGAIILYILINANLITQHVLDDKMVEYLRLPGATAFGFAFIAGFSERIVFPQFR